MHNFIILAYKDSPYIEECILSLINQTVKSPVSIATSTPSDFLIKLADKYNIPLIVNKKYIDKQQITEQDNISTIDKDWNFALARSKTIYLTLAHQDDVYLPDYTKEILKSISSKHQIIFTDYAELINKRIKKYKTNLIIKRLLLIPFYLKNNISARRIKKGILSLGNPISCPTVTFNLEKIKEFSFREEYNNNLDWDGWLRLADQEGVFNYIPKKLVLHRIHKDSETSRLIKNSQRLKEEEMILTRIWGKFLGKLILFFYKIAAMNNKY